MNSATQIKTLLIDKIRHKLANYNPETSSMPFHYRLLGRDRMALYSFVHSINTTLGQSIFEQVAVIIAKEKGFTAKHHFKLEGYIPLVIYELVSFMRSSATQAHGQRWPAAHLRRLPLAWGVILYQLLNCKRYISDNVILAIDKIEKNLKSGSVAPNKNNELEIIKSSINASANGSKIKGIVDVFLENKDTEYYFEIKTAKPNIDVFKSTKKKLLEWSAIRIESGVEKLIKTVVVIPYNPYEPEPYERWTLRGLFDLKEELLVGKEFWDLIGGENTYEKLLSVFEEVGIELYDEIDKKMKNL